MISKWLNSRLSKLDANKLNWILKSNGYFFTPTYVDPFNLITRQNAECLNSAKFRQALDFAQERTGQTRPEWTSYVLVWAAETASKLAGSYVELGVERGFHAFSILRYTDLAKTDREFVLFDSFSGVDQTQLLPSESHMWRADFNEAFSGFEGEVRSSFSDFDNVRIVSGFVPKSLKTVEIEKVAFLHIDLNSATPEKEALRYFWPKLSPGALVILDDYNQVGREAQREAIDELGAELGFSPLSLPTGQGLIVAL